MRGKNIIVIADDITGAAELAGIAHSYGLATRLLLCSSSAGISAGGDCVAASSASPSVLVLATDTRSMTETEAGAETRRIASRLSPLTSHLFKKTDSALRGHVVAELQALLAVTPYTRALYMPANPSKGRTIRDGVYYVGDRPISETAFSFDPEFPATTARLSERFPNAEAAGIVMPDASTTADIRRLVAEYDDGHTLFAGAADLFTEVLLTPPRPAGTPPLQGGGAAEGAPTLILCGSTQSKPIDCGIPIAEMPRAVYDGEQTAADWLRHIAQHHSPSGSLILTIPHKHLTGKAIAVHLRTVMAEVARLLVARRCPAHLIIEGGATAWATLQALGWTQFTVERQVAPGVVQMRTQGGTLVTLKPGSYPWGHLFSGPEKSVAQ